MYNHEETEMKALLIDVMENKVETVDVNGLEDYYKLIHCTTIDIVVLCQDLVQVKMRNFSPF